MQGTRHPIKAHSPKHHRNEKGKKKKGFSRKVMAVFFTIGALGAGYTVGGVARSYVNKSNLGLGKDSLHVTDAKDAVESSPSIEELEFLNNHPLVKRLREDVNFKESKYYDEIPHEHRENMVTAGLLAGKGYLTFEPLVFTSSDQKEMIYIYHVGDRLAGKEGVVHGGLLATLMDEGLSRCSFPSLPNGYGVTAQLDLSYKQPVPENSFLVLHAQVEEAKGRRVTVEGRLRTLEPILLKSKVLVEGKVVMVEPRWAKYFIWLLK